MITILVCHNRHKLGCSKAIKEEGSDGSEVEEEADEGPGRVRFVDGASEESDEEEVSIQEPVRAVMLIFHHGYLCSIYTLYYAL